MLVDLIDLGLSAQATIEAPRWVHDPPGDRFSRDALVLESGLAPIAAELGQRGHDVIATEALDYIMGTVQMIRVDRERGYFEAVSDPRGDGVALAL
jgi:gamma-glutamyltranspeptidase/glutathione hydrolase